MRWAVLNGANEVESVVEGDAAPAGDKVIEAPAALVGDLYLPELAVFSRSPQSLAAARAAALAEIDTRRRELLSRGAPYGDKLIEVGFRARTDLAAMAAVAALVVGGALAQWPHCYARGWITADNSRVPMPTAHDGVVLASYVLGWYGELVQFARDAKDDVLASQAPGALRIDWSAF